jgi:hypothetical protein
MFLVVDGREVTKNDFRRRKPVDKQTVVDVSGPYSTYKGPAVMEGLSQFFLWRTVVDWNGTRTDEQHTSFVPPFIRPFVLPRDQWEGCIKCLRRGGLSYWIPYGKGYRPFLAIPECITRDVVKRFRKDQLDRMIVGTYVCRDLGQLEQVGLTSTCTGVHLPFAYSPFRLLCNSRT